MVKKRDGIRRGRTIRTYVLLSLGTFDRIGRKWVFGTQENDFRYLELRLLRSGRLTTDLWVLRRASFANWSSDLASARDIHSLVLRARRTRGCEITFY